MTGARPVKSRAYPWYDSVWLDRWTRAREIVRRVRPGSLGAFDAAFDVLRTRPDFETTLLPRPFDDGTMAEIRDLVRSLRPTELEMHEAARMGRFVVHDHPFATELAGRSAPMVAAVVGEPVEASYTFLSLYTARGVCGLHMDAPQAKWTLDLCVDQSVRWPIHFSRVVPWPDLADPWGDDWEEAIKAAPEHRFTTHTLEPGQAIVFSGSSQWHYRDPIPAAHGLDFCTLLFLHYVPAGAGPLLDPTRWAETFGIPELDEAFSPGS